MSLTLVGIPAAATSDRLADAAVAALVTEARLTPKPGLVDLRGPGSHHDMHVGLLVRSAEALRPTFTALAVAGAHGPLDQAMRARLAAIGRAGERVMLATTRGVNTHRGAIWALGLAVAVSANDLGAPPAAVLAGIGRLTSHGDPALPNGLTASNGARSRERYGVAGAVGAARSGFPAAATVLEALRSARADGHPETDAQLTALLASIAVLDDTCLLHRGGPVGLELAQHSARRILHLGGPSSTAGSSVLADLDQELTARGLSPGGSADMFALAFFLDASASRHLVG